MRPASVVNHCQNASYVSSNVQLLVDQHHLRLVSAVLRAAAVVAQSLCQALGVEVEAVEEAFVLCCRGFE